MIDQHKQAFQEEARELLVELESALLELDQNRDDREVIGRAFRALHTIKGSGAMFGFEDVSRFAHNLESAFDQLRNGRLRASSELIALTLAAGDQIKGMLEGPTGPGGADPERAAAILAELGRLTGSTAPAPHAAAAAPMSHAAPPAAGPGSGPAREWRIHFRPGLDALLNGTNPLLLLRELGELGELRVRVDLAAVPRLGEIDPERCYLAWDMLLRTSAEPSAIQDVFIFVEGECELSIEPAAPSAASARATPAAAPQASGASGSAAGGAASSIRVSADKLDQLVNLVGELVTVQARLGEIAGRRDDPDVVAVSEEVERLTAALRENSMSIRMLPLRGAFERFRRLVHDLGIELHKEVELTHRGRRHGAG